MGRAVSAVKMAGLASLRPLPIMRYLRPRGVAGVADPWCEGEKRRAERGTGHETAEGAPAAPDAPRPPRRQEAMEASVVKSAG